MGNDTKLSEKAQAALDIVVKKFQQGDLSPVTEVIRIKHIAGGTPSDKWSLSNRVLAFMQTGSVDCRGFNQWKEVKRAVKKGESAAYILAPRLITVNKETEDERKIVTGFLSIAVFADYQTDGAPIPVVDYAPAQLPPLADVAAKMGISVSYGPLKQALGACTVDGTSIKLGTHETSVFFHELAHAAHARIETLKGGQHVGQETVAEFTAAVLSNLYGFDTTGNAWDYIKGYSADPMTAITKALSTVEKVLEILGV